MPADAQRPEPAAPNWALLKFTPPAAAALALATIGSCYSLAKQHGHLPPGATTPPISLFGVRNPEYRLYAVGMSAVSALFCTMAAPLHRWLSRAAAPQLQDDVTPITLSAVVAFGGLAVHGVVPLQEDIVEIIGGRRAEINSGTQVHQMAASVFFMCALPLPQPPPSSLFLSGGVGMRRCSLYHGWQMIQLQCSPHAAPLPISWARAPSSVLFKVRPSLSLPAALLVALTWCIAGVWARPWFAAALWQHGLPPGCAGQRVGELAGPGRADAVRRRRRHHPHVRNRPLSAGCFGSDQGRARGCRYVAYSYDFLLLERDARRRADASEGKKSG